jgi:hypothetical protein
MAGEVGLQQFAETAGVLCIATVVVLSRSKYRAQLSTLGALAIVSDEI